MSDTKRCNEINPYHKALKLVSKLKIFIKDDFNAFDQIKNLESHCPNHFFGK